MKKILSILLVLAFVLSFISCNKEEPPVESPSESSSELPNESESDPKPELGLGIDLSDNEITIVHWDEAALHEFFVSEEDSGHDAVSGAVYERNRRVEELLGVKLNFEHISSISSSVGTWFNMWCDRLQNMMDFPPNEVDLFACYSKGLATATVRGLNKDMSSLKNIDFSKAWWPKGIEDSVSVGGGKIFYLTGEISPNAVHNMYTVFYNKDILADKNVADPAALVKDKGWTVDKLIELSSGIYSDIDGTEGKSKGDSFGLALSWWSGESIVNGAGYRFAEDGGADEPIKLSSDLDSSDFSALIKKLADHCKKDGVFNDPGYNGDPAEAFRDGRAAFWVNAVGNSGYIKTDVDYGILPMPLLNSDQGEYITPLANTYSNYAIARACDDDESAAAVLSALAYYGQALLTPTVYEISTGNTLADGGAGAEMFLLMAETINPDVYSVFARELRSIGDEFSMAVCNGNTLEDEFTDIDRKAVERDLEILNGKLEGLIS